MDPVWLLLLLPLAAAGGWLMARFDNNNNITKPEGLPEAYFKGLNFLLNEEPDKALKIFLEVVEVDRETVEMHLALGNLFRRRGEIERATRIHQNLVARTDLEDSLRCLALFELAQDYFKAGLFGRAENLFLELQQTTEYRSQAGKFLLQIYDQEKEWKKAIQIAIALQKSIDTDYSKILAHYHCEIAESALTEGKFSTADSYLKSAFKYDQRCVRAVIQAGRLASMKGNHAHAIAIWRELARWAPSALGEVAGHVSNSYQMLKDVKSLKQFLESAVETIHDPRIIAMLVELTEESHGRLAGETLLLELVRKYPSLDNLYQLMKSRSSSHSSSQEEKDFSLLARLLGEVVNSGRNYNCRQCGFQSNSLHWQCPGCKGWGTIQRQMNANISSETQTLSQVD